MKEFYERLREPPTCSGIVGVSGAVVGTLMGRNSNSFAVGLVFLVVLCLAFFVMLYAPYSFTCRGSS